MKVFISAAEASSDAHGAGLLEALKDQMGAESVEAIGVGGPKLQAQGLRVSVDARELLSMGFVEVLGKLPRIFRALNTLEKVILEQKPEVAVLIDYPEFHFRLARKLRQAGVPTLFFIPPKVWVWRKKRIYRLKDLFARILSILPFEEEIYREAGVPLTYVGNPLLDQLPLGLKRSDARLALGLGDKSRVLAVLPGSRPAEIRAHLDLMLDAACVVAARLRSVELMKMEDRLIVCIPLPVTAPFQLIQQDLARWMKRMGGHDESFLLDVRLSQGNSSEVLVAADGGMIKSGTSTLEAGMLDCPHLIVYRPHWLTEWIFKWIIRYRGPVGLVNLVHSGVEDRPRLIREILCSEATPRSLADEALLVLTDASTRHAQMLGFEKVRAILMRAGGSPSRRAADEVVAVWKNRKLRES